MDVIDTLTALLALYLKILKTDAWTGNKGVFFRMLTMLRVIFTPGLEIRGSFLAFQDLILTESSLIVNTY
ncbi:protein of unknown function [Candidatus Nitrosotalea okcheonensis]|uniref:Uncharacterized protein n=1 Tax=Candidatus Nitrosotalea okcheonensis TaxID=1903276 RepID=A0A2H1FH36_9ARCH|nr:protein of unknown function [Candidatus Nitrosotalea okcheonensis]